MLTPVATTLFPSRSPSPLSDGEQAQLERSLKRLRLELRAFLASLPVEAQTASGMARCLGVERTTCQRLVASVTPPYTGLDLAAQLPGRKGLEMLVDAADGLGRSALGTDALDALRGVIRDHDAVVRGIAGSQSRLAKCIRQPVDQPARSSPSSSGAGVADAAAREMLFHAASTLTGRSSDLWLAAHIYTPVASGSEAPRRLLRQTRVNGLVGHKAKPDAVPMTLHVFGKELTEESRTSGEPFRAGVFRPLLKGRRDAVLESYSSEPLPVVRARSPNEAVVQTIDDNPDAGLGSPVSEAVNGAGERAFDLLFGLDGAVRYPLVDGNQHEEVWAILNFPARRIVFDVLMHRDVARRCITTLDVHLWGPDFARRTGERWQTRFSAAPRLQLLGSGLAGLHTDAYPRYEELMGMVFETIDADVTKYVGYRCELTYPIWRAGYRMLFDFGTSEADHGG